MKDHSPSKTAAWVAAARAGFGVPLPDGFKLCDDPYGMLFAGWIAGVPIPFRRAQLHFSVMRNFVAWMQVRTRFIDDTLLDFVRSGGRQVVILGAGFDCRAIRFASQLPDTKVFEVDHPATQRHKLDVLQRGGAPASPARYVTLDFEKQSVGELPAMLAAAGHDARVPTLTIWEGVTMYLTEPAIEASLAAVREYSAEGSPVVITYFDIESRKRPTPAMRLFRAVVSRSGEPWKFGWQPDKLGAWLKPRGFSLRENASEPELSRRYLPEEYARGVRPLGRWIAVAEVGKSK